jgi:hypothetical protein
MYAEGGSVGSGKNRVNHEKGVNITSEPDANSSGTSKAGERVREGGAWNLDTAKDRHRKVLKEHKGMPGPTSGRSGFAEGGEVDGHMEPDGDEMDIDMELSHGLGQELMHAFEAKDHKKLMSALEACVLHCMSKNDEE